MLDATVDPASGVHGQQRGVRADRSFHAHLDDDAKKAQLQPWLSGEARVMVATRVIGCGYNYSSVRLVIHLLLLCTKSLADSFVTADRV